VVKSGRGAREEQREAVVEQQRAANGTVPSTNNGSKRKAH